MASTEQIPRQVYRVQVLDRVFQILKVLADQKLGAGLTEVADVLKLHKSTAHRLIMVLDSNRFIEKDQISGKYHIGSQLMELGLAAASRLDVYGVAEPYLRTLVLQTDETAQVGVIRNWEVLSLICVESSQRIRLPNTAGTRTPVHSTSLGKAILAFSPPERLKNFLRGRRLKAYTSKTIVSTSQFKAELRKIRKRGYSFDNEERETGLRCVGAPIRDGSGEVIAAVSIAGPAARITIDRLPELAAMVQRAATDISTSLGYFAKGEQI